MILDDFRNSRMEDNWEIHIGLMTQNSIGIWHVIAEWKLNWFLKVK